jgi:RNA polymerase sporulation-specific sigma factor
MNKKVDICGVNTAFLPKLTNKEADELLLKIKNGDKVAREKFVVANIRLVLSVIKKFYAKKANVDDVFQAGCLGLIKATDNFDVNLNVRFSTYAVPMIIGDIKRYLRDVNSLRVPRSIRDTAYKALKTREEIEKNCQEATIEKIADEMGVAVSDVTYALDSLADTVSLNEPVYNNDGDELLLMDQIADERDAEEECLYKVGIEKAISKLPEREKRIVLLRYYIGKTQTEISEEVGISQAQVSRLEKNALKSMKQYLA